MARRVLAMPFVLVVLLSSAYAVWAENARPLIQVQNNDEAEDISGIWYALAVDECNPKKDRDCQQVSYDTPEASGGGGKKLRKHRKTTDEGKCFTGETLAWRSDGSATYLKDLSVGDEIAVQAADGSIRFAPIYAFGHKETLPVTAFISITSEPTPQNASEATCTSASLSRSLALSPDHFLPTYTAAAGGKPLFKRARDIVLGDVILAIEPGSSTLTPFSVVGISKIYAAGLVAPYTLEGTVIVNGVLASIYSQWFLDGMFDALGLTSAVPAAYQAILTPLRLLYTVVGKERYICWSTFLHSSFSRLDDFATDHASTIVFAAGSIASLAFGAACLQLFAAKLI